VGQVVLSHTRLHGESFRDDLAARPDDLEPMLTLGSRTSSIPFRLRGTDETVIEIDGRARHHPQLEDRIGVGSASAATPVWGFFSL
jgi:hypothetical protein